MARQTFKTTTNPIFAQVLCALSFVAGLVLFCSGCNGYSYGNAAGPYPPVTMTAPPGTVAAPPSIPPSTTPIAAGQSTAAPGVYAQNQSSAQLAEMQRRMQQLDDNNRQLTTQVAQLQQQAQAFRQQSELLARQLDDSVRQNKQLLASTQSYASQARGLQASMTQRGGATITANSSLAGSAAAVQIPGALVFQDGNLVRIRIPADQLFAPGSAQLNQAGTSTIDQVAGALARQFARQRAGIEGHTDTTQLYGGFSNPYQLTGAQAQAVMDQLVRRNRIPTQQLSVVAQGPNKPIADNQTAAGRAENRRIEVVIYPETF